MKNIFIEGKVEKYIEEVTNSVVNAITTSDIMESDVFVTDKNYNTKTGKDSTTSLIPYGKEADGTLDEVNVFCIGDSYCAPWGRSYYPQSGWGEHLGDYFDSYATFENYGVSGAWAHSILSSTNDGRYQDNIANGKAPLTDMFGWGTWDKLEKNIKSGDYIIVSLGINDVNRFGPDKMNQVEWYAIGIEEMVKKAKALGANIILCSAMHCPEFETASNIRQSVLKTKQIAEKYDVPFLDVDAKLQEQYFEEFDYSASDTAAQKADKLTALYSKYYLDRDSVKDESHEFHLTDTERAGNGNPQMKDDHETGRNPHPNLRGADNMARWIAELLKQSDSDLRFYLK